MKRRRWRLALFIGLGLVVVGRWPPARPGSGAVQVGVRPAMFPELQGVTVPPNIAPPGLRILVPGDRYHVVAGGAGGTRLEVGSRGPDIVFPLRGWRRLLAANRGGSMSLSVAVRQRGGGWQRYAPLTVDVASEPIDRYLVYRWVSPLYNWWNNVGVYQRDLTSFGTTPVLHGRQFDHGCTNCHNPCQAQGDQFTIGFRSEVWGNGTLVVVDGKPQRLNQAVGYGSWHPSGQLVVFSINQVRQFFHAAGEETRDVLDLASGLVCYDVAERRFTTAPQIAAPDCLETYPCWSPDGKWLYFARARKPWQAAPPLPPPGYADVRYSLMRVAYDEATGSWGEPETVRSGEEANRSFVFPRVSPDGRWLLYTSCAYGCFPIHHRDSDLELLDLQTGADVPLTINSDRADTWHSWSRDGRWIVFASKRADGLFTKLYLSYFDRDGVAHAPLLLPARDPGFYDTLWYSYNVPELRATPVPVNAAALGRALRSAERIEAPLPEGLATRRPTPDVPR